MRAFVAVLPPTEVVEELMAFLEPRREALAARNAWRWTRPEHLHLTLAFLPELQEWREEGLIEDGERWAGRTPAQRLRLTGAGCFPDPGAARVLWAGVRQEDGEELLAGWAARLRALASRAGARVDGTRFSPHVTVARSVGRPHPAGHLLQALDTFTGGWWEVSQVALVRSHLGAGPRGTPRYEVRHRWDLG